MNPANVTNGATDDLFYPANYGAEIQLDVMRQAERQTLNNRLTELLALPREQWEDHGAIDMSPEHPGKYGVFFGEDGIAWVIPDADGRFGLSGLGSQKTLEEFRRAAEEGEDE